jgi:hypothetical protein
VGVELPGLSSSATGSGNKLSGAAKRSSRGFGAGQLDKLPKAWTFQRNATISFSVCKRLRYRLRSPITSYHSVRFMYMNDDAILIVLYGFIGVVVLIFVAYATRERLLERSKERLGLSVFRQRAAWLPAKGDYPNL